MSTKSTIAHGPTFHLYHEVGDSRSVYLRLDGAPFDASYDRVTVPIPVHVWEHARRFPGIDLSFADATDAEITTCVEGYVDGRIAQLDAAEDDRQRALAHLAGSIPYGPADDPREDQIARGLADEHRRRTYQREVRAAIERLRREDRRAPSPRPQAEDAAEPLRALSSADRLLHDLRQHLEPDDSKRDLIDEVRAECQAAMESLSGGR